MRSVSDKTLRLIVGVALLMGASSCANTAHAQGGPASQVVILPNPTPRPADPHDTFRDDPVLRAREQQMIALKRAKMHAKVVSDARDILVLAQQIRDHRSHQDATATGSDLVGAQQIEKLAKQVKENTKVQ